MTSNSPLKRASLLGFILYLSILSRSRLTPGTVSTRPSKEAEIWNSLKRQAATQPVVALERPTWSLMMTGVLMFEPIRVLTRMSKSPSRGAAELQTGIHHVNKSGELGLQTLNDAAKSGKFLNFNLFLSFVDVNKLKFASILLCTSFNDLDEFFFISLSRITSD